MTHLHPTRAKSTPERDSCASEFSVTQLHEARDEILNAGISLEHARIAVHLIDRELDRVAGMPVFRYLGDGRTFTVGAGADVVDVDLSAHWDAALVCWLTLSGDRGREDIARAYASATATRLDSLRHQRQRFADYLEQQHGARRLASAVRQVEISRKGFRLKRAVHVDTGDPYKSGG